MRANDECRIPNAEWGKLLIVSLAMWICFGGVPVARPAQPVVKAPTRSAPSSFVIRHSSFASPSSSSTALVNLAWDPTTDPDVINARLHWGTKTQTYTAQKDLGLVTSTSVPDPQIQSFYAVTWINAAGLESVPSNEVSVGTAPSASPTTTPTALTLTATINDSAIGAGPNQWNFDANWFPAPAPGSYNNDEHYAYTAGGLAHFRFTGSQIKIYTHQEPQGGNIGYSIDGGPEKIVSNYGAMSIASALSFTSAVLAAGNHDLAIRVVGSHEPAATSDAITVDKAEVYAAAVAAPTPTPTVTPSPAPTPSPSPSPSFSFVVTGDCIPPGTYTFTVTGTGCGTPAVTRTVTATKN